MTHLPRPRSAPGEPSTAPDTSGTSGTAGTVVVTTVASDSHTWNLVFLQLLLEERGYRVINLGPCVPDSLLLSECLRHDPALVVVSSVNGHGHVDGLRLARTLRGHPDLATVPVVIGGKLGVSASAAERGRQAAALLEAGFDAVFDDGQEDDLRRYLDSARPAPALTGARSGAPGAP
ncbi:cobalamin B12-binding domain-containing protein [Streptomyces sp. RM99]|uniref:cobalamin B12-binding domain-containing protein n=1 Tax=Streptomyces sp. RM99 TaxID=2824897 RepID=UPI001B36EEA0|nr:cobalamin-dependent protein [Streptomyces sp. RM99]MBQ0911044.1 cobalamin-dependent protein [Streptomyces sp. RM99]